MISSLFMQVPTLSFAEAQAFGVAGFVWSFRSFPRGELPAPRHMIHALHTVREKLSAVFKRRQKGNVTVRKTVIKIMGGSVYLEYLEPKPLHPKPQKVDCGNTCCPKGS